MANIFGVSICQANLRFSMNLSKIKSFLSKDDIEIKMALGFDINSLPTAFGKLFA
ncbi:hypothetical protein PQ465_12995 [Sphingobacterium oryzagri]|uniref:Uncharacterized protein n=1 Tax=Sphingobacterium oryzagri TaxID=3025669 RepID=A0ABY7WC27_9SPHI|nr:hypothetical protein [Sphingobacterium sp. KACC 22765]WDF67221.1 hypothetical protein PQ465_12995 [Sphingobacterium sp. KACC 22765]